MKRRGRRSWSTSTAGRSRRATTPSEPIRVVSHENVFRGCLLDVYVDRIESSDGTKRSREIVVHPGAVAIVPVLPNGDVLLVRQYRHAVRSELWEIPAGKLEPDEETLACAKRELREETGYVAEAWRELASFFTTPGFSNERIALFLATGLTREERFAPGEIEACEPFGAARLAEMVADGRLADGKTLVGLCFAGIVDAKDQTTSCSRDIENAD